MDHCLSMCINLLEKTIAKYITVLVWTWSNRVELNLVALRPAMPLCNGSVESYSECRGLTCKFVRYTSQVMWQVMLSWNCRISNLQIYADTSQMIRQHLTNGLQNCQDESVDLKCRVAWHHFLVNAVILNLWDSFSLRLRLATSEPVVFFVASIYGDGLS